MLDEAWFYFANQQKQIWLLGNEDSPTKAQQMIDSPKTMLTLVGNPHRFHLVKILPTRYKWTSQSFRDHILPEICTLHFAGDRRKLVVHADNANPHTYIYQ
jgi:hypothetical protein